jgi:hypothetical protein
MHCLRIFLLVIVVIAMAPAFAGDNPMLNAAQEVRELSKQDHLWLEQARSNGFQVLKRYEGTVEVTPSTLDRAFQKWKQDTSAGRASNEAVAQGLGVLFGDFVVMKQGSRWAIVTDSFGTDLAVVSSRNTQIYPINAVWKRIDPSNEDMAFFEPIWSGVLEHK